jgi:predicted metal-dependent hydrolase
MRSAYVSLDWRSGALAEGLACYRHEEFFEAHEHWEDVWRGLEDPEKSFLQSLIQMTVAFHHLGKGNSAGAASLLRRALRRLEICDADFGGIAVAPLRQEVRGWIRAIENADSALPADSPRIVITHD